MIEFKRLVATSKLSELTSRKLKYSLDYRKHKLQCKALAVITRYKVFRALTGRID